MRGFVLLVSLLAAGTGSAGDRIRSVIVPRDRIPAEKTAAQELTEYLGRMTGEKFAAVIRKTRNGEGK